MSSDEILERSGVVLIDELDLHLHPQWQRQAIRLLPEVFPNVQFIVTTHSPQMIGEVEPKRVVLLPGDGKAVLRPENTIGLSSNDVLSMLMKTPERDVYSEGLLRQFRAALDNEDYAKARGVLADLEKHVGNANTLPLFTEAGALNPQGGKLSHSETATAHTFYQLWPSLQAFSAAPGKKGVPQLQFSGTPSMNLPVTAASDTHPRRTPRV